MRNVGLLACRVVLGCYFVVHGTRKLTRKFGGAGLASTAAGFEALGLQPAGVAAGVAGGSQLLGGALTVTGVADPLGPLLIAGNMVVASVALRAKGPMAQGGGYELPITDLALATALAIAGPGRLSSGYRLPRWLLVPLVGFGAVATARAMAPLLRSHDEQS